MPKERGQRLARLVAALEERDREEFDATLDAFDSEGVTWDSAEIEHRMRALEEREARGEPAGMAMTVDEIVEYARRA